MSQAPRTGGGGRRAEKAPSSTALRSLLPLALAGTAALVAWGFLVYSAIDFGVAARDGKGAAWLFLVLAGLGAVACLFLALLLLSRITRALGITSAPPPRQPKPPREPRQPGGRRAAR
ncbi:hypothetical protein [Nocardioides sp. R-C-SC26]|uniref:hypothetical protein n=1 Tax=Nocardioides sp. R-C-SC26 TaxID=2870414 RepID=UPI001E3A7599|nr:hypothetical protein [Nocardioides sp. R-C-SC26]